MIYKDTSTPILTDVKKLIADLIAKTEEFVLFAEKSIQEKEHELDVKIKELAILKDKEKTIEKEKEKLTEDKRILQKEKQAMRDRQITLERKEKELQLQIQRVQDILK